MAETPRDDAGWGSDAGRGDMSARVDRSVVMSDAGPSSRGGQHSTHGVRENACFDVKGKGRDVVLLREEEPAMGSLSIQSRGERPRVELVYRTFVDEERDLGDIMRLCDQELSEPYNLYTFRYFLQDWPHLTYMVYSPDDLESAIGTIVCKQDMHRGKTNRGYIAMLSVDRAWRRRGIASSLVRMVIEAMVDRGANEVVLETEYDNGSSLSLYGHLGFVREKRLHRFYSNGKDAFRLILPLPKANEGRGPGAQVGTVEGDAEVRLSVVPEGDERGYGPSGWEEMYT